MFVFYCPLGYVGIQNRNSFVYTLKLTANSLHVIPEDFPLLRNKLQLRDDRKIYVFYFYNRQNVNTKLKPLQVDT